AVLHDLNLAARFADELVFLRDGAVTAVGSLKSVLTKTNIRTTFDVDCLIQDHPHTGGPLITPLPHGTATNLAPAQAS
ncbi:MAG: ABC transporter ATP-binding protein, partial [Bacteroidota bacterium]